MARFKNGAAVAAEVDGTRHPQPGCCRAPRGAVTFTNVNFRYDSDLGSWCLQTQTHVYVGSSNRGLQNAFV